VTSEQFNDYVRAAAFLLVVSALAIYAFFFRNDTALGAVISVSSAAAGWWFRGRVETPTTR
jgi:hypothetical protein